MFLFFFLKVRFLNQNVWKWCWCIHIFDEHQELFWSMLQLRISVSRVDMGPQCSLITLLKNCLSQKELWMIMELNTKPTWIWDKHVISGKRGILKGIVLSSCWNIWKWSRNTVEIKAKVVSNAFHSYTASISTFPLSQGFLNFFVMNVIDILVKPLNYFSTFDMQNQKM